MWILRKEKIGDSSGGVSVAWVISGGLREKIIDGGRDPTASPLFVVPLTGEKSEGGVGVSGDGVWRGGRASVERTPKDLRLSFPESLFLLPPKVEINERTRIDARGRELVP